MEVYYIRANTVSEVVNTASEVTPAGLGAVSNIPTGT